MPADSSSRRGDYVRKPADEPGKGFISRGRHVVFSKWCQTNALNRNPCPGTGRDLRWIAQQFKNQADIAYFAGINEWKEAGLWESPLGSEPKQVEWYESGHGLPPQADVDMVDWLAEQIGIDKTQFSLSS